jgi:hypothetical protein
MAVSLALQSILDKAYFKYSRSLDDHLLVDDRSDNLTLSKDYHSAFVRWDTRLDRKKGILPAATPEASSQDPLQRRVAPVFQQQCPVSAKEKGKNAVMIRF